MVKKPESSHILAIFTRFHCGFSGENLTFIKKYMQNRTSGELFTPNRSRKSGGAQPYCRKERSAAAMIYTLKGHRNFI